MLFNIFKLLTYLSAYLVHKKFNGESIYLADKIVNTITTGENVFWKLSQWISSRIEFQIDEKNYLIDKLKIFYDKCPVHSFDITRNILENYFQKPVSEIFDYLEEIPEASGSIAQVHTGILKNGKKVAIKVRHPNIDYHIEYLGYIFKKMNNLKYLMKIINFDTSGIDTYLMEQTNFDLEAGNFRRLRELFKHNNYVLIPEIYYHNNDFIIMEYIGGQNIDEFYKECMQNDRQDDHREIMIKLWLFIRESILIHNFFHADLHKGNWRIQDKKIVIYDLGLILKNPDYYDVNQKIWSGFECRSSQMLAEVFSENLINCSNKDEVKNDLIIYLDNILKEGTGEFPNHIKKLVRYLNDRSIILNFHTLSYLLAFNLASLNFKNFYFVENDKSYYEQHLERLLIFRDVCQKEGNIALYKRLEEDEDFFIKMNADILKQINNQKDEFAYDYLSSDSE